MKWELHTYYNEPVNGNLIAPILGKTVYVQGRAQGRELLGYKELHGKEHSLLDPVGLNVSCPICHKSYNGMDFNWKEFKFCPNCAEKVEGIDETTLIWDADLKKYR